MICVHLHWKSSSCRSLDCFALLMKKRNGTKKSTSSIVSIPIFFFHGKRIVLLLFIVSTILFFHGKELFFRCSSYRDQANCLQWKMHVFISIFYHFDLMLGVDWIHCQGETLAIASVADTTDAMTGPFRTGVPDRDGKKTRPAQQNLANKNNSELGTAFLL